LQSFDYEIVYKPGYLNCIADILTREKYDPIPLLGMFYVGAYSNHSNSAETASKRLKTIEEFVDDDAAEHAARQLFVSSMMTKQERAEVMQDIFADKIQHFLDLTLIKAIKDSPCRINILEKWERKAFNGCTQAYEKLRDRKHFINLDYEDEEDMMYVGLDSGIMFTDTY